MRKIISKVLMFCLLIQMVLPIIFLNISQTYATPAGDNILISEVQYDPATPSGHTSAEVENEAEWFELYNPTNATIDIGGWTMQEAGGPIYTFPSPTNIASGDFLLVTNRTDRFQLNYPGIVPDLEMDPGGAGLLKLNNTSGDSLTLKNSGGTIIDHMAWEGIDGYDLNADAGFSTCRRNLNDSDGDDEWANNCSPTLGTGSFVTQFPGGVAVASLFWGKVESESYTHGNTMTTLSDRSGNNRDAVNSGTPSFDTTNTINFYPTVSLDGASDAFTLPRYTFPVGDKNYTMYSVFTSPLSQDNMTLQYVGKNTGTNNSTLTYINSDGSTHDDFDNGVGNLNSSPASTVVANTPTIVSFNYNSANNDKHTFVNGESVATIAGVIDHNASNTATSDRGIGMNADGVLDNFFLGNIAEVLVYDSELIPGDRQKIDSYLALKYGITLDQTLATNYINSSGAILWDATINASYTHDIIGIGQNNLSDLDQKISHSIHSGAILTLATTADFTSLNTDVSRTSLSDGKFLITGNNAGAVSSQTGELDGGLYQNRITREWKVANTGGVGSVNLKFDGFDDSYALLTDTDGDFSSGAVNAGSLSSTGTITTILNDGEYFTLATLIPNAVSTDISLYPSVLDENAISGTLVGNLHSVDADIGDSHSYTFVAGAGDSDNAKFTLSGSEILSNFVFDYESQATATVRIQTDDGHGGFFSKSITITIYDIDEIAPFAPVSAPDLLSSTDTGTSSLDNITTNTTPTFQVMCTPGALDMRANLDEVKVSPYGIDYPTGSANWRSVTNGNRDFLTIGQRYRVRQDGDITAVELSTENAGEISEFYVKVWRFNGIDYDLIGTTENLATQLVSGSVAKISLATPLSGVQEGDYIGYKIYETAIQPGYIFHAATGQTGVISKYVTNIDTGWNYDWDSAGGIGGAVLPIGIYMQAPQSSFIGDSIIAGHPTHYSFLEHTATTNIASTIEKKFGNITAYNYQNMGIGSQTTTSVSARFQADILDSKPRLAIVEGGVNDLAGGATKATFLANYTSMLDAAQVDGIPMLVMKILPWTSGSDAKMLEKDDWNTDLETLVNTYDDAYIVDLSSYVGQFRATGTGGNLWDIIPAYNADGVHFNAAGHQKIAEGLDDFLQNSLSSNTITLYADGISYGTYKCNTAGPVDITLSGSLSSGTYDITYNETDIAGNTGALSPILPISIDTVLPVMSLVGSGTIIHPLGSVYTDLGATWTDNIDGTGSVTASGTVNTSLIGSYILSYDYTDAAGNMATQVTRTVEVVDGTSPIVTLSGATTINIVKNTVFVDGGATWTDNVDGSGVINSASSGSVDTSTVGTYILEYTYTDAAGNVGNTVTRTVHVTSGNIPVISLNGGASIIQELGISYIDAGAIYSDIEDGTGSISASGTVDVNTVGTYILTYDFTDSSGNAAIQVLRTIQIIKNSGGGGASTGTRHMDICNATGGDYSGSYYDGKCEKVEDENQKQEDVSDEINENIQEETTQNEDTSTKEQEDSKEIEKEDYTLEKNFQSCPIILDIQNPQYKYKESGVFSDEKDIKYKEEVLKFADIGIVNGYNDGSFLPKKYISRTEFLKVVLKSHCYEYKNQDTSILEFKDVKKDIWQAKVIAKAQELGIIHGDVLEIKRDIIDKNLGKQYSPESIEELKRVFVALGLYTGEINTYFTDDFIESIYNFQLAEGVIGSQYDAGAGFWGPQTRAAFFKKYPYSSYRVFRPNDIISKAEAIKILMNISGIRANNPLDLRYTDVGSSWEEKYVITGESLGLFDAEKDLYLFYPHGGMNREDMVHITTGLIELYK